MTLSAVLLAGGESRRMGREKATLVFAGEVLWQRQIRLLRGLNPEQIYLSARGERSWQSAEVELVRDKIPSRGPLSGIAAVLRKMETSHLFVLAVDMPFVTADDLLHVAGHARKDSGVVPIVSERAEPLVAVYPKEAYPEFATALRSNDTSLQPLIRILAELGKVQLVQLAPTDAARYRSVNTPEDLVARQPAG